MLVARLPKSPTGIRNVSSSLPLSLPYLEAVLKQFGVDIVIQVDQEMLFEIILAANYLDIKPLL